MSENIPQALKKLKNELSMGIDILEREKRKIEEGLLSLEEKDCNRRSEVPPTNADGNPPKRAKHIAKNFHKKVQKLKTAHDASSTLPFEEGRAFCAEVEQYFENGILMSIFSKLTHRCSTAFRRTFLPTSIPWRRVDFYF